MINKIFPVPKFVMGQEVKIKENYTCKTINEIYVVAEIKLSCVSVLTEPRGKEEPFTYSIVKKEAIGAANAFSNFIMDVRESFIVAV